MRYAILGSGSTANSYVFEHDDFAFVVDNGFSLKEFSNRAQKAGFDISKIKLIFLTHKHADHARGIEKLSKELKVPVVMSRGLLLSKSETKKIYRRVNVEPGKEYNCEKISFSVLPVSHDCEGSVNYSFNFNGYIFTVITDTGKILEGMEKHAINADILFIEANYCPQMLADGPYPLYLKKRIESPLGHLSNDDVVKFLSRIYNLMQKKNKMTYLCHLSDTNNCYEKLKEIVRVNMPDTFKYRICRKSELVEGIDLFAIEAKVACT
ncbi:MAG: MBL fold metallo-hydrolase [Spirochaetes bacterium]|nr:MBL fold metallo-hydrolase [Spirochaetota bacterium]